MNLMIAILLEICEIVVRNLRITLLLQISAEVRMLVNSVWACPKSLNCEKLVDVVEL